MIDPSSFDESSSFSEVRRFDHIRILPTMMIIQRYLSVKAYLRRNGTGSEVSSIQALPEGIQKDVHLGSVAEPSSAAE